MDVSRSGRLGQGTVEKHPEITSRTERNWPMEQSQSQTMALRLLRRLGANLLGLGPKQSESTSEMRPLTGKPDALIGPVRFGGRGEV